MRTFKILVAIFFSIAVAACGSSEDSAPAASTFNISGTVSGPWVEGVTITLTGGSTTTTNASGAYSFVGLPAGTYTVTPGLAGYTYTPSAPSLTISANTTQNFTASSAIPSYSISGTVSYKGTKTGPIGIRVYSTTCSGCSSMGGAVIPAVGAYTVRGLKPGNYKVVAEMDALGTAIPNATNPIGSSVTVTVDSQNPANLTNVNVAVVDSVLPPVPVTPALLLVAPGNGSAFVMYSAPKDAVGQEIATSYKIDYGATISTSDGSVSFAAQGDRSNFYVLSGLTDGAALYFKMTALVGTTESAPSVSGPVTIGNSTVGATVSGAVTFPGAATGPMMVGLYNTAGVYFTRIASPASPQDYNIAGVPPGGSYLPFAVIDMNSNGVIDSGDIGNTNGIGGLITVAGNSTGNDIALSSSNATASVNTDHGFDGTSDSYQLILGVNDGTKHAVAVTLVSGPNVAVPFDMGANRWIGLGSTIPSTGDSYMFKVTYLDGTTENISGSVTGVLSTFATATNLVVTTTGLYSPSVPLFTWAAPSSPPPFYIYRLSLASLGGDVIWDYPQDIGLPSSTLSAAFNVDGKASAATLAAGSYFWQVRVMDANGNSASILAPVYSVP